MKAKLNKNSPDFKQREALFNKLLKTGLPGSYLKKEKKIKEDNQKLLAFLGLPKKA